LILYKSFNPDYGKNKQHLYDMTFRGQEYIVYYELTSQKTNILSVLMPNSETLVYNI